MSFLNLSGYAFTSLCDIPAIKATLKELQAQEPYAHLRGTILLAPEGVNLFLSGDESACYAIIDQLCESTSLTREALQLKPSWSDEIAFNRFLVKIKKEIIAFDEFYSPEHVAPYVSPAQLDEWYNHDADNIVLLDTRNTYETELGTFKNAIVPPLKSFKDLRRADILETLEPYKSKKVITFCTGGIRCEKAATFLKQQGFNDVYQLHGGILRYFEETTAQNYTGECFVFDKRVSLTPTLETSDKHLCYACRHPLTIEDMQSPYYKECESCPYCHK
ncbi:MAG: sulfurtransferase [Gammaproteobacteria bacterium]|nr:sulfurtransferase [Gammaproteobacteria bacterium]